MHCSCLQWNRSSSELVVVVVVVVVVAAVVVVLCEGRGTVRDVSGMC